LRNGSRLRSQKTKVGQNLIVRKICIDVTKDVAQAKKSRRKRGADAATDEGDVDNFINGGISGTESEGPRHRPPRTRTRPVHARAAKDKVATATSSSENDDHNDEDDDAFGAKRVDRTRQAPARKSRAKQSGSVAGGAREEMESGAGTMDIDPAEELELDDPVPVVLNGSPFATPSRGKKRPRPEEDEPENSVAAEEDESNDVSKFPRRRHKKVKL
jgi:hypothetical protein